MNRFYRLLTVVLFSLGLSILWTIPGYIDTPALAAPDDTEVIELFVAIEGVDASDCRQALSPCRTIQYTVDQAPDGALIKVSEGVYSDVFTATAPAGYDGSDTITQVLYLDKPVTLEGGYSFKNGYIGRPDSDIHPTSMNAISQGRTIFAVDVVGAIIDDILIMGGDANGLGGYNGFDAGGGLYAMTATLFFRDAEIHANYSGDSNGQNISYGGGAFLWYSPVEIINTHVTSNTMPGGGYGGGIYALHSDFVCDGCIVSSNRALDGAGAYIVESDGALFTNSTIHSNDTYAGDGGGAYIYSSDMDFISNTIRGNKAYVDAGALYLFDSDANLSANLIISNSAKSFGGAISLVDSDATLINNVFINNKSLDNGSTIMCLGSDAVMLHNTVRQWRRSPGIVISGSLSGLKSDVVMKNMIFDGITDAQTQKAAIEYLPGNTLNLNGVIWSNISSLLPLTITPPTGTGIVVDNQTYMNVSFLGDGFHIPVYSAARDRGIPAGVVLDIDKETRDSQPDMGADEYLYIDPNKYLFLPYIIRQEG